MNPARFALALVPAGIAGVLLDAVLQGVGAGAAPAAVVSIAVAVAFASWLVRRLPPDLDDSLRKHTILAVLWFAFGVATVAATARLATFMVDGTRVERSIYPFDEFFVHHSCLSAHYRSASLQRDGVANVYERTNFEGPGGEPRFLGPFVIDIFIYPPPFLLLSRLGLALSEDFATWRAVWFGIEGAIVAAGLVAVALSIGGAVGRRALVLALLVWFSVPLLATLQFGNFHLVAITGSVLAMLAIERGRHALGGAVLAALTLGKIFPGILILLLLFQRRWRSLAWVAGFAVLFLGLSWVVLGEAPFRAMLAYNLPRLSSGEAFESIFAHPDAIAASHSVFALVQKLGLLGVPGASPGVAGAVTWLYSVVLVGCAWLGARVATDARSSALVWLTLLQLTSLRSPFTPDTYAMFAVLWILTLLLAGVERPCWRAAGLVVLLVPANYTVPTVEFMPLPALLVLSLVLQLLFMALCLGVLIPRRAEV
ncbi:MAG TPA: glycosyltransferase family 87 protein [Candidatus Polarisedimenticolia bacterium]|nr:glycosyltransferase family 87 protein [Candidatus Polarisedimenticolia bacterium]